jgi:hypothetical protein
MWLYWDIQAIDVRRLWVVRVKKIFICTDTAKSDKTRRIGTVMNMNVREYQFGNWAI